MAATLQAKINRKRLDKLDIIKICKEILNPSVPMPLRLSGILMGGMVIVYQRRVKLLYDDVSRLLIEINEAWRIRPAVDHTARHGRRQRRHVDGESVRKKLHQRSDSPSFRANLTETGLAEVARSWLRVEFFLEYESAALTEC